MKLAILSDSHWGVRGDNQIFLDYFSRFHREILFPYLEKHNINTVVHLGDLVDRRKQLNFNTAHHMRTEYIEPSMRLGLDTHIIAGNHDCFHKNSNEVNALREIVMGRPGFTIYSYPTAVSFGERRFLMLPWISPENEERTTAALKWKVDGIFAHLELVGFEMARGQMMEHGMDPKPFQKVPTFTGHYHHKSSKGKINYVGSMCEMTWADHGDQKGFHILDTETMKLEFIPNPLTLYHKVYTDHVLDIDWETDNKIIKVIVTEGTDRKKLDKFIGTVEKSAIEVQVIDEHLNTDQSAIQIDDIEDTFQVLKEFVAASEFDVDKDALITLLKELYSEANQ